MVFLTELTELATSILMGILFSIFASAFFILILVLKRTFRHGTLYSSKSYGEDTRNSYNIPEITLLKPAMPNIFEDASETSINESIFECENFHPHPQHHQVRNGLGNGHVNNALGDAKWSSNAPALMTHCMGVLINCRTLTERLTGLAISMLDEWDPHMGKLVEVAKMITVRVDQLVNCMRPPLNPHILEARAASLTLAVAHLAIMTQYECNCDKIPAEWMYKVLNNIQRHLEMLNAEREHYFGHKESVAVMNGHTNHNIKHF